MKQNDILSAVQVGTRPSGPDDYGPHTDCVKEFLTVLKSNFLLRFKGQLDDQLFVPVNSVEDAQRIAYEPEELDFHWQEDGHCVWGGEQQLPAC